MRMCNYDNLQLVGVDLTWRVALIAELIAMKLYAVTVKL